MSKQKWYVVWVGRNTGVFSSWNEAFKQVDKFKGAKYQSFSNFEEASIAFQTDKSKATESKEFVDTRIDVSYHIYCDGACDPNPGESAAGISVYHNRSLHALFYGAYKPNSTNNAAELNGLIQSLKIAKIYCDKNETVQILCDSMYSINCVTNWSYSWKQNGWKNKSKEIKNLELIKLAHALYEEIKSKITVSHIKGHNGFEGNELADRMTLLGIKRKEVNFIEFKDYTSIEEVLSFQEDK